MEIKEKKLERVLYEIEFPIIPILAQMETRGIGIDKKFLLKYKKEISKRISEFEKEIYKIAGCTFNINSSAQVSEVVFKKLNIKGRGKTKTGRFSTRESELVKLKNESPIAALILEYREMAKLLTTYVNPFLELSKISSKVHTTFNQTGTVTGRLSSDSPNLQNIPFRSEFGARIRNAFIVSSGFTFVSFDYSQIELKILAALSKDKKMIEAFQNDVDIHRFTAANIYNVPLENVTQLMRNRAKVINFGIIYGMGVRKLAENTGMSSENAQKFYKEYFETFPQIKGYMDRIKNDVKKLGYVETFFGRRRYFNLSEIRNRFYESEMERMAANAVIQGTDADIVKLAMSKVYKAFSGQEAYLLLQIHDELLYEIRDDIIKTVVPKIKQIMESICDSPNIKERFLVPLSVDVKIGKRWGSLKKI